MLKIVFVIAALFCLSSVQLHAQVKEYIYLDGKLLAVEADGQASFCTYTISPSNDTFTSGGGTETVSITASDSGCYRTATSNAGWINITGGASGTGSGTVSYSVAANSDPARSGTITVAEHTFIVRQSACTYSISPTSEPISSGGGADSVNVSCSSSNCGWTATSNASWINITSGSSGTGNGTVNYSVAVNPAWARSGTATIAGKTFTVIQSADSCYYYCQTQFVDFCIATFEAECQSICYGDPVCVNSCMIGRAPQINAYCTPEYCIQNQCQ